MSVAYTTRSEIATLLATKDVKKIEEIRTYAMETLLSLCGDGVYYRGLVEFSNRCALDCFYCGIRRSNSAVSRFDLEKDEIVDAAVWCAENGYGSLALQSGERASDSFVDFVCDVLKDIKRRTKSDILPNGLGITLSIGEHSEESYQRFYDAGAHRFLLRIETTNRELYRKIHPKEQTLERRIDCLRLLKKVGFQVGTGVMFGLPGQTYEMLADDILFFKEIDVDMIGMGPYISHKDTPLVAMSGEYQITGDDLLRTSLLMIAACRLVLQDVNIAATTALETIDSHGREKGLSFGANVVMPQLTPVGYRKNYLLYDNKPCLAQTKEESRDIFGERVVELGRKVCYNEWGDSLHYKRRSCNE